MLVGYWAVLFNALYTQYLSPVHWFLYFIALTPRIVSCLFRCFYWSQIKLAGSIECKSGRFWDFFCPRISLELMHKKWNTFNPKLNLFDLNAFGKWRKWSQTDICDIKSGFRKHLNRLLDGVLLYNRSDSSWETIISPTLHADNLWFTCRTVF